MCGRVSLHVPVVDLNHTGEENGEKSNEEQGEGERMLAGEIAHRWQRCSIANDTIVK
jgi:hypothetical protein